ncbi:RBBP9/YdeN family alpha/beta hydrolase [Roseateles oligotrophus]|uniref:Alpha/beta fold hydrolase n=1 Tax=Roseateles oligotrophus TaxID=1769250 RepID=A0ABT2YM33_9BURK|nr:alpha/beta hydrolase [Roseateles oligotrophus]MCV2371113.1 alpha/beta fold hydrolase [Roseateles oligotrophus]
MKIQQRILLLPGWLNSDPDHWQSHWEQRFGYQRVEQADWEWPRRGDWMARLDEVLLADERPTFLVAHSLGSQLVASWAEHSQHAARVAGALLVAPPDTEAADMPPQLHNWRPIRRSRLPFPSITVVSSDDPFCAFDRAAQMATDWGSRLVEAGPYGHLNTAANLGQWEAGQALLAELLSVPRE